MIRRFIPIVGQNKSVEQLTQFQQVSKQYGDLHSSLPKKGTDEYSKAYSKLSHDQREAVKIIDAGAPRGASSPLMGFGSTRTPGSRGPKSAYTQGEGFVMGPGKDEVDRVKAIADDIITPKTTESATTGANSSSRTFGRATFDNKGVRWALDKMGVDANATYGAAGRLDGGWKDQLYGAKDFFWSGSGPDKAKKIAAGAGVYMGANLIGRGITGGGATYDNTGQRDIMGIPFV